MRNRPAIGVTTVAVLLCLFLVWDLYQAEFRSPQDQPPAAPAQTVVQAPESPGVLPAAPPAPSAGYTLPSGGGEKP